jgi:charged multivesicular body protein 6
MGGSQSNTSKPPPPPPRPQISSIDRATLDLKNARDRLTKYQRRLEADEAKLIERARQAKFNGKPQVALQLLKIKKIKRNELDTVSTQLLNVLAMVQTIDSKQNEAQVLNALKTGKDALQKLHEETSVEDVLELMDAIQEQNQMEQEISDILSGVALESSSMLSTADEEAIERELEQLMMTTQTAPLNLPEAPTTQPLPVAPSGKLGEPTVAATNNDESNVVALPS